MWDYDHNTLPLSLRANLVHNYRTRAVSKGSLHHCKVHTYKHGIKSFKYQGIKILKDLKSMRIYQDATCKSYFYERIKIRSIIFLHDTLTASASLLSTCDLILLIFFYFYLL